jgi:hypothetical protein
MTIVIRFFPNGEFTQGIDTSKKRQPHYHLKKNLSTVQPTVAEKHTYLTDFSLDDNGVVVNYYTPGQQFTNADGGIYTYLCKDNQGHHFAYECTSYVLADVIINEPIGVLLARGELSPLVHQSVESSSNPQKPSRKRLLTMTSHMARNIRNGVYLLENEYGKDLMSFLTLTIPNLNHDDLALVSKRWDYMTDEILKEMRKMLDKKGIEFEYVYCTEIQTKRLQQRKEYAPHLHIIFRGRIGKKSPWAISPKQIRKAWTRVISRVVGHREFCNNALENLQRIQKSAARYLAKYMSKGNCCIPQDGFGQHICQLKTQWGGMARSVSRKLRQRTLTIRSDGKYGELAIRFARQVDDYVERRYVKYVYHGFIPLAGSEHEGMERGIKVCAGCLSYPLSKGGMDKICEDVGVYPRIP